MSGADVQQILAAVSGLTAKVELLTTQLAVQHEDMKEMNDARIKGDHDLYDLIRKEVDAGNTVDKENSTAIGILKAQVADLRKFVWAVGGAAIVAIVGAILNLVLKGR